MNTMRDVPTLTAAQQVRTPASFVATLKSALAGLNLAQQVTIAGLLFLIPLFVVLYFFLGEVSRGIDLTEKEQRGLQYIRSLYQVHRAAMQHRDVSQSTIPGDPTAPQKLNALQAQAELAMKRVDAVDARVGAEFGTTQRWNAAKQQWAAVLQSLGGNDPNQSIIAYGKLFAALASLKVDIADRSSLTTDPDPDSYYLMDGVTAKLQQSIEQLSYLRGWTWNVAGKKVLSKEEQRELLLLLNVTGKAEENLVNGLNRAFGARPALKSQLGAKVSAAVDQGFRPLLASIQEKLVQLPESEPSALEHINIHPALANRLLKSDYTTLATEWVNDIGSVVERHYALVDPLSSALDELLQNRVSDFKQRMNRVLALALVLTLLAIAMLYLAVKGALAASRRLAEQARLGAAENRRNQTAILRLLNEIEALADGDLKVRASVSEDITGAIADSVNYAVDELQGLVSDVHKATEEVTLRTHAVQEMSAKLLDAAEQQSNDISQTSDELNEVVRSIHTVSSGAAESTQVAQRSLAAAQQGQAAVQNSIKAMNEIRDHIQETSKRIKRLGESSQQIGEIVELISDITAQTNVLALNAAIQAVAAGEAGRGFAIVAEEVQRLAERSAEATKQVGAIVRIIQADTHDAVVAMERSTQGVVEGAALSDGAGQALGEITLVSKQLAELIGVISAATLRQVAATDRVALKMQRILEFTRQSASGTEQTAGSVKSLAEVGEELKVSVARFKF
jgi:methyl-accepting chemotaxis protein